MSDAFVRELKASGLKEGTLGPGRSALDTQHHTGRCMTRADLIAAIDGMEKAGRGEEQKTGQAHCCHGQAAEKTQKRTDKE